MFICLTSKRWKHFSLMHNGYYCFQLSFPPIPLRVEEHCGELALSFIFLTSTFPTSMTLPTVQSSLKAQFNRLHWNTVGIKEFPSGVKPAQPVQFPSTWPGVWDMSDNSCGEVNVAGMLLNFSDSCTMPVDSISNYSACGMASWKLLFRASLKLV